jgi:DNA-directed RNA polymerase specialized sigma subunit
VTSLTRRPKRFYRQSSPTVARAVRELYFVGRLKQQQIGRMFGLSQGNVSRIVSRQVWDVR